MISLCTKTRRLHFGRSWYRGLEGNIQEVPSKTAGKLFGVYGTAAQICANLASGSLLLKSCFQKWHPIASIVQGPQQSHSGNALKEKAYKQSQLQIQMIALGLTAMKAQLLNVQVEDTRYPGWLL